MTAALRALQTKLEWCGDGVHNVLLPISQNILVIITTFYYLLILSLLFWDRPPALLWFSLFCWIEQRHAHGR